MVERLTVPTADRIFTAYDVQVADATVLRSLTRGAEATAGSAGTP